MTIKIKLSILFGILILLFISLIVDKCLQMIEFGMGGQVLKSPNGQYEAYINAFETPALWTKFKRYYELSIYDISNNAKDKSYRYSDTNRIKRFRFEIIHKKTLLDLRGSEEKIIQWSPDSSQVTYSFEGVEINFNVKEEKD